LRIKLRDSLVRARVGVINSLRFTLKSLGYAIANPSTERFHKVIQEQVPESVGSVIAPSVQALKELSLRIKLLDREIATLARSKYPETTWLEQIPGVGPITALYFVLKIQDPARFERVRDVGAFHRVVPAAGPEWRKRSPVTYQQAGRRLLAPAPGQRRAIHPGTVRTAERSASVWIGIGPRRHSTCEEACGRGGRSQTGRSAFDPVEEQECLSSLPPQPR
jgi:transposase